MSEMKALEVVVSELEKVFCKYQQKAERERQKLNDVYVTIQGEKYYSEAEIYDCYACDCISSCQYDKYTEMLQQKKERAGELSSGNTQSEWVCKILRNAISNYTSEIKEIQHIEEEKRKKEERWEISKAQGCSYQEFLELEEINRQSEEFERNQKLGIKIGYWANESARNC